MQIKREEETFEIEDRLPLLPLRDVVLFPYMTTPLLVGRVASVNAIEAAVQRDRILFATAQTRADLVDPGRDDLFKMGTVVRILQLFRLPDGTMRVLVEGICRLMQSALHDPVNIGNPQEMTLQKLAEVILRITGSHSPIKREPLPPDDPKVRCPDISLARRALGWEPKVGLEEGLRETASWFRQNLVDTGRKIR